MDNSLRAAVDEFTTTMGMLYLAQTGKQPPKSALELVESARTEGILPSDAYPLVRDALQGSRAADISGRPMATLLREMYQATAWSGSRLIESAFLSIGFVIWQGEDVPLNWGSVSTGFFAQRSAQTLFVCPLYTRETVPTTPTAEVAMRLLAGPYEAMRQAPGFRGNLPFPVIIQTGSTVGQFSHSLIASTEHATPSYHFFTAPLAGLNQLGDTIRSVFG